MWHLHTQPKHVMKSVYLLLCNQLLFYVILQTEKEIATLEGDIKELKAAIDAKNAPMMVSFFI